MFINVGDSHTSFGMIGSAYFAGYSLSCLLVPRLADLYGRRLPLIASSLFQFLIYFGIFFSNSYLFTVALILVFGFCGAGRSVVGYLYLLELVPGDWKTLAGTSLHSMNSMTFIISAIYFWFISKDWRWIILSALIANGLTALAMVFIPESPAYLYSSRDFDKTRDSLNKIARLNGSDTRITDVFDIELEELAKRAELRAK